MCTLYILTPIDNIRETLIHKKTIKALETHINMTNVKTMNITADENIPYVQDAFKALGHVRTVNGRNLTQQELLQTNILLVRSVTNVNKELLHNTPVQFVASATAGFNHIDLDYLTSQNIGFARAAGSNAISAAEYVFSGICLWSIKENKTLSDLSIGIIGYGNVGSRVKQLCEEAGLNCVINDPPLEEKLNDSQRQNLKFSNIDNALNCDIVTLHTPLTYAENEYPTYRLLNQQRIEQLKPQTLFINAARGEVVEEPALLARMKDKHDLTLILDVWENEPKINTEILELTLIGTPHIAGYSIDGKIRGTEMIYQATCEFLDKKPQWSASQIDFKDNIKSIIHISSNTSKQRREILKAYNIVTDNNNLKKILTDKTLADGHYFDSLRKNYPPRREFSTLK